MSNRYCNCQSCAADLADLKRQLAASEAQLVAMREALSAVVEWERGGWAHDTFVGRGKLGDAVGRCAAALAQPHSTEALREFGLRVVAEATRGCAHDCYRRESDAEVVDAVLKGTP